MTIQAQINAQISVAGISIASVTERRDVGAIPAQTPMLAAGKAGTLSTRTNPTDGTLTFAAEHGIVDSDVINIFWTDANGVDKCAYGATVGVVNELNVPFTGANGDALPDQGFAIVASVRQNYDCDFDGDLVGLIAAHCPRLAHVEFLTNADVSILARLLTAKAGWTWASTQGHADLLAGDPVGKIAVSCGETTAGQFTLIGNYDSEV